MGGKLLLKLCANYRSTPRPNARNFHAKKEIKIGKILATIVTNVPVSIPLENTKWVGFIEPLRTKLLEFEMYSLIARLFPKLNKKKEVKSKKIEESKNKDQISMF